MKLKSLLTLLVMQIFAAGLIGSVLVIRASAAEVEANWIEQFGPVSLSQLSSIEVEGDSYVSGVINNGALPGQTNYGSSDVFVRKYDANGTELWTRQFGTSGFEFTHALTTDGTNVYVTGQTSGTLPGMTSSGGSDSFIRKYDANGTELWTRQFGTSSDDTIYDASADANALYVAGSTRGSFPGFTGQGEWDAYVVKYDLNGNIQWTEQFGTDSNYDDGYAVYVDNTGVYVGGTTGYGTSQMLGSVNVGGGDAYLRKYDTSGVHQWTEQFGTIDYEHIFGIGSDESGIYITGETYEAMPGETHSGDGDVFVAKYSTSGTQLWLDQFGTSTYDTTFDIAVHTSGVYVSGYVGAALPGQTHLGGDDSFIRKYNSSGEAVWTYQYGTSAADQGYGIDVDSNGVIVTGRTNGAFPGNTNSGGTDLYVARIGQDDFDSDSIFDEVDSDVENYSDDYSDGTTSGTITTRGDQVLTIEDAPDMADGVLIKADVSGGISPALISSCGGTVITSLDSGDEATVTCGSAIVNVASGTVEATFTADNGTISFVALGSGNKVTFKPEDATIEADLNNVSAVEIVVNEVVLVVQPGQVQPVFITVAIDIKPGSSHNTINLNGNGVIPVAILTTENFNAEDVDSLSVSLEGAAVRVKGNSGNVGTMQDVDNDGDLDLLLHIENDLALSEGSDTAELTGFTLDGTPIGGSDVVNIVP